MEVLAIERVRKKVVKMTMDINAWMNTFENDGIKWRWLSKKETARINSKFLVYFLNFPEFTGFPAHQHLCNLHFSLIFSLVRKL